MNFEEDLELLSCYQKANYTGRLQIFGNLTVGDKNITVDYQPEKLTLLFTCGNSSFEQRLTGTIECSAVLGEHLWVIVKEKESFKLYRYYYNPANNSLSSLDTEVKMSIAQGRTLYTTRVINGGFLLFEMFEDELIFRGKVMLTINNYLEVDISYERGFNATVNLCQYLPELELKRDNI